MATKTRIVEPSFRIGAGRYLQDNGILKDIGKEVSLLKGKKAFVMGGTTALSLTQKTVEESLNENGIEYFIYEYKGFCVPEHCDKIVESDEFKSCDVVIGIGGGVLMDSSKLCAVLSDKPVICVPTSSATCAAYAPLSVTYSEIGKTLGTKHHNREVNCVIVDMDILAKQPARLFVSGVYDSLAKLMELNQRLIGKDEEDIEIGLRASYELSKFLYERLNQNFDSALESIKKGEETKEVFDCVYLAIGLTGVVSGLARGSNQTAIAHKIYESARKLFPEKISKYLHGEVVAVGLIVQAAYNGTIDDAVAFKEKMSERGMLTSLNEIGVEKTEENFELLYNIMLSSTAMAGTTEEEQLKLKKYLHMII